MTSREIRSGLSPAEAHANLYNAIALMPEIEITERRANLDGRRGTAIGLTSSGGGWAMIIDPRTDELIGERGVMDSWGGVPPGTVTSYAWMTTAVVDELGQRTKK